MTRLLPRCAAALAAAVLPALLLAAPAHAVDGALDYVEPTPEGVRLLMSVPPDADLDLAGVTVTIAGQDAEAVAVPANTETLVRRTTVLAIDTSNSMRGERFSAAKRAAESYISQLPDDVYVGLVGFADDVEEVLAPTQDHAIAEAVLSDLELSRQTRLYDGVIAGVQMLGEEGQRSLLVLSDGADTSETPVDAAIEAAADAGVLVDVVALEQRPSRLANLERLAEAGGGVVVNTESDDLSAAFAARADVLATQVLVTADLPEGVTAEQAEVAVSLPSDQGEITASAFTTVRGAGGLGGGAAVAQDDAGWSPPGWAMYGGVLAIGLGLVVLLVSLVPRSAVPASAEERITAYTRAGAGPNPEGSESTEALTTAREAVEGVLSRNESLDAKISARLEGAGSRLKSAEWVLVQVAIFLAAGAAGLLLGGGNLVLGLVFCAVGAVGPWLFLGFKRSRRRKAFNAALPDTLQLMSGSLSAGLSLAQSVDTIVREGTEPVASEFRRVLVETRLGVPLEVAFDGVAERFGSKDFEWVVMAIRIQRQVGGNLAELLDTVAATMREREYLRRQVNALAAEGKLSAIVLSVLPPGFLLYLLVAQRDYVMPLFTDVRGIVMLVAATAWLLVGIFWMSKLVKVEV
ncbi:type II secretion system F family protein [Nocardioides nanhaiensis]|uniref:VWFA domain-containing protein n=1 Tax=Nocardioides nanhaiensis TaxID=1476871 RepID=A0ABP8WTX8_9ACTN